MNTPRRIQRKRTKGWRMPEGAIYVGRPTRWGNPFTVLNGDHFRAAATFDLWAHSIPEYLDAVRDHLAGRDLACWCPLDQPCHADVLLEVANQ